MQEKFPREQELYQAISKCAYKNHNQVANDSANVMFNYKNLFIPMCNPTCDQGMMKYLLELKGELPIQYKGNTYSIITSIGFPFIYPDAPAVIRIYNPDNVKFTVNQYFIQGASPDQSVVNINIPDLANWYSHKSIARVMINLTKELGANFPFFDRQAAALKQQQQQLQQQNYGQVSAIPQMGYQGYNQQPGYGGYNQNPYQNQNVYPNNNPYNYNAQQPYNNQPNNQQYNPYAYNQVTNPQGQPNSVVPQQQNMAQQEKLLRDKCVLIIDPELNKMRGFFKAQKELNHNLLTIISEQEKKNQNLKQIEGNLDKTLIHIQAENNKLQNFIEEKDTFELNENTVLNYVCEEDPFSAQIVDCASDIQAYRETLHFILQKFRNTDISYEVFIKTTRKIAEEQFYDVLLLKKCQGLLTKK